MKLNKSQLAVLESVSAARKATYLQAKARGGNGKTLGALVEHGFLDKNPGTGKNPEATWSLTALGKTTLKDKAKAAAKAAKLAGAH